ncbi:hypothetical protein ACU6YH_21755 [Klebsiella aerogenes]
MMIDALQRLGLDDKTDDDNFQNTDWILDGVARQLAGLSVCGEVPASWLELFASLCETGRELDEAAWTYFYSEAVKDEEWLITMENSEADF